MGKKLYDKIEEILIGLDKEVRIEDLKKEIMIKIGCDERTIKKVVFIINELNLMEKHGIKTK
jgi:hypothetical protein